MKIFQKKQITQKYKISKKDYKKYSNELKDKYNYELKTEDIQILKHKNKFFILSDGGKFLFFNFQNVFYPTIQNLGKSGTSFDIKTINLDKGARKPILSGANVMGRGIYVNFSACDDFLENEVVAVKIEGEILAVGKTLIPKDKITQNIIGEAIEIHHVLGDDLYLNKY